MGGIEGLRTIMIEKRGRRILIREGFEVGRPRRGF